MRWMPALVLIAVLAGCAGAGSPAESAAPSGTGSPSGEPTPTGAASSPGTSPGPPSEAPSEAPSPQLPEAPRVVGPDDDGATFALSIGRTTTLRLDAAASEPDVSGSAVILIEQVNVTASGSREWEVRAVEPGEAAVSAARDATPWTIRFVVSD